MRDLHHSLPQGSVLGPLLFLLFTGAPKDGFLLNTLKTLFKLAIQSTFRSLEMHSKRRYKICTCPINLGRKLDIFEFTRDWVLFFRKWGITKGETFSGSKLHQMLCNALLSAWLTKTCASKSVKISSNSGFLVNIDVWSVHFLTSFEVFLVLDC